jgi:LAS superfamily LD-carboxypeptidase LdcB
MLATAAPNESFGGKIIQIRAAALEAYRRMVAAARAEDPEIAADAEALTIFSGYRSPSYDAERCARDGNCNGVTRAQCSAHRTGLAFDLVVGHAPGYTVDSSADPNRLHMTRTPAYLWLVDNAQRFGFVNYVFEPWHWEWTGESVIAARRNPLSRMPRQASARRGTQGRFEPFSANRENARAAESP